MVEHKLACCVAACRLPQRNRAQQHQRATRQHIAPAVAHQGARKPHRSMPSHTHAADQPDHARNVSLLTAQGRSPSCRISACRPSTESRSPCAPAARISMP